ncbi:MAG: diguanylate cyclase [Ilumatobacteraceae bacterium]
MSVVDTLNKMQQDAIEQLRNGSHSEFLVGFLTTSVLLELSNLLGAELELPTYAQAVADTLTQHAPVERCAIVFEAIGLPGVAAAVGFATEWTADLDTLGSLPGSASIDVDGVGRGVIHVPELPPPLMNAGFLALVAGQITSGISRVVDDERLRRGAAASRAMLLVASLDERWNADELNQIARAMSCLPDVSGCTISALADRFNGALLAEAGRTTEHVVERMIEVESGLAVRVVLSYLTEPGEGNATALDEVMASLLSGFERIEENIRVAAEADTDALTGVGNRRRASKALAQARAAADMRQEAMSVLLCDLDHFKRVNDQWGHEVGDQVLVRFAALLRNSVRGYDTVVRWGGEEFLIICPGCDHVGATSLAERLIKACAHACAPVVPDGHMQTTSIGIAVYPVNASTPEALVNAADDALYLAKRGGRNSHRLAP